ncbi:MAG: hypothetical protein B6I24_09345 [Bacteroidetes bacterium 4572_128]|nr:MAG: hypothetical protein B6I24_09345 [Bacteroidetes bacterium 4572_128]
MKNFKFIKFYEFEKKINFEFFCALQCFHRTLLNLKFEIFGRFLKKNFLFQNLKLWTFFEKKFNLNFGRFLKKNFFNDKKSLKFLGFFKKNKNSFSIRF